MFYFIYYTNVNQLYLWLRSFIVYFITPYKANAKSSRFQEFKVAGVASRDRHEPTYVHGVNIILTSDSEDPNAALSGGD